jgi:purine-binding chemotaxis protein CheW
MNDLAANQAGNGKKAPPRQVLTFTLGSEVFAVDVLQVTEIRDWSALTQLPNMPPYVRGVLNLRGKIVPIVDLRRRFHMAEIEFTPLTVIVVMAAVTAAGRQEFGAVVDGVSDVIDIAAENMRKSPHLATKLHADFIQGLATVGDQMLILLDVDALLGREAVRGPAQCVSSAA